MELKLVDIDPKFPIVKFVSINHKWEMGVRPVLYGVRVSGNRTSSDTYCFDYCAGNNYHFAMQLFRTMQAILMALPESITERELERMLPTFAVKPIDRDPTCWQELQRLAIELNESQDTVPIEQ